MIKLPQVQRIFAYLQGTKNYSLTLGGIGTKILGFSDSNGMSTNGRHPIAGYVFKLEGAFSWSSKKQQLVTLSTTEVEYVALSHATKEAIWLRNLLREILSLEDKPMLVHCDNQGAIVLSKDDRFHQRTKHIDI